MSQTTTTDRKCTTCRTDLYVGPDAHNGLVCRRCDATVRTGVVSDPVPMGDTVFYLPGKSGTTYHTTRQCLNLIQSDREVLAWTPEIARRSGRDPCQTCAAGVDE